MSDSHKDDDFTPQEKQERFEAALRAALKKPPMHRSAPKETKAPDRNLARKKDAK